MTTGITSFLRRYCTSRSERPLRHILSRTFLSHQLGPITVIAQKILECKTPRAQDCHRKKIGVWSAESLSGIMTRMSKKRPRRSGMSPTQNTEATRSWNKQMIWRIYHTDWQRKIIWNGWIRQNFSLRPTIKAPKISEVLRFENCRIFE